MAWSSNFYRPISVHGPIVCYILNRILNSSLRNRRLPSDVKGIWSLRVAILLKINLLHLNYVSIFGCKLNKDKVLITFFYNQNSIDKHTAEVLVLFTVLDRQGREYPWQKMEH